MTITARHPRCASVAANKLSCSCSQGAVGACARYIGWFYDDVADAGRSAAVLFVMHRQVLLLQVRLFFAVVSALNLMYAKVSRLTKA